MLFLLFLLPPAWAADASSMSWIIQAGPEWEAVPQLTGDPSIILSNIYQDYQDSIQSSLPSSNGCSADTITVRKEWNNCTPAERTAWIDAMKCMNSNPSQSDTPGARTRYDDFTAAHISRMPDVHFSPWLLLWHRYFLWLFEKALQEECGYSGGLIYADWLKYTLPGQPGLFSGSMDSLGGDGVATNSSNCTCVSDGPFSDWVVNLGPVGAEGDECNKNPSADGLSYNPRCLYRKFDASLMANLSASNVASTIIDSPTIDVFSPKLDIGGLALHATPHVLVGGLQGQIPASSHDPWFMTHHPCLDRLYSLWVAQDVENRTGALASESVYNDLRAPNGWSDAPPLTLDSEIYISDVFANVTVRETISTTDGLFCYMYE